MLDNTKPVAANLTSAKINPAASRADIRAARRSSPVKLSVQVPGLGQSQTGFEAVMAANQTQNNILNDVLKGPVSQQTQRQLAKLKETSARDQLAEEFREVNLAELAQAVDGEANSSGTKTNRRPLSLGAGTTIATGLDTGRRFTPSQLVAFKQKNGLGINLGRTQSVEKTAAVSSVPQDGQIDWPVLSEAENLTESSSNDLSSGSAASTQSPSQDSAANESILPDLSSISGDLESIIARVGEALSLDPALIKAVIKTESNFNSQAVSSAGAQGLMQLMPGTAKELGVKDPFNPLENIWGGARYLKRMLENFGGNLSKALAAYNWGPGNLKRFGGKSMPKETRRYIEVVTRNYDRFKKSETQST
ncbi:MAG: lytic transglycosylase domain-containing protein [Deltaproteobacteria bacterium]|jgi:hypothetical protein|nr:lytic transglycosylase domain-containing protein [Deltaproteobacteria bacterium]